eukprot:SAG11_NODE_869_length_6814_cov_3.266865_5_plen_56_part_01
MPPRRGGSKVELYLILYLLCAAFMRLWFGAIFVAHLTPLALLGFALPIFIFLYFCF